jgi:hypothetical protein
VKDVGVGEVAVVEDLRSPRFTFTITFTVIIMEEVVVAAMVAILPHRIPMLEAIPPYRIKIQGQAVEAIMEVIPPHRFRMLGQAVEAVVVIPWQRIQIQGQAVEVM